MQKQLYLVTITSGWFQDESTHVTTKFLIAAQTASKAIEHAESISDNTSNVLYVECELYFDFANGQIIKFL